MTSTVVDLAMERAQRNALVGRLREGGDDFIGGLQRAGQALADLGWLLSAPVRHRDRELADGIHQLALDRLAAIIDGAIVEGDFAPGIMATMRERGKEVAFAAFTARLIGLAEASS